MAKTYYLVNTAIKKYIWVGQDTPTDKAPYLYSDRWIGRVLMQWAGQPLLFVDENWVFDRDDFEELEEPEDAASKIPVRPPAEVSIYGRSHK